MHLDVPPSPTAAARPGEGRRRGRRNRNTLRGPGESFRGEGGLSAETPWRLGAPGAATARVDLPYRGHPTAVRGDAGDLADEMERALPAGHGIRRLQQFRDRARRLEP